MSNGMATHLILNADDFGISASVNAAVVEARRRGVLTSASLMVTGDAFREAVSMARDDPALAVGLHLTLTRERTALPREAIPDLVDKNGRFMASPVTAALRYYFNHNARRQTLLEIEAQFERFAETGLAFSHVDGHQHLHAHPAVLPTVVDLATRYGACGIRLPRDPFIANLRADRARPGFKLVTALGHACLARVCRQLRNSVPITCDFVIGSLMSGRMTDAYVIRMLSRLNARTVEVFFHPCLTDIGDPYGPNPGDLRALTSLRLRQFIADHGWTLSTYPGLRGASEIGR
ncbi:MAG: hopanoid biosynthesis-associated protein HpnK [Armatimonadetes bacterium]|nr:hopanoid biosynthesis-associated protein HpnK [Armatimonadota bacterium]